MQLGGQRSSGNVEDRRGMGIGGGIGIGGIVIALIAAFLGIDPGAVLNQVQTSAPDTREAPKGAPADEMGQFVSKVLASTEDVWTAIFRQNGRQYQPPTLVLYTGAVRSACGMGQAAMGPFYCPNDQKLYIDLKFYEDLKRRFRAPGDFAQAYVIAHEVGHHVQNLLGTMGQFNNQAQRLDERRRNQLAVRLELQADCYAGVWGHFANRRNLLEAGDLEEGLRAAAAVGDDQIMKRTQGYVVPDAFTHGSAEQRTRWFRRGLESGDPRQCDTFSAQQL